MLTKKRFLEIVLLTMAVVLGGGYVYNSLLNDIKHNPYSVQTGYYYKPSVRLDNFKQKKRPHTSVRKQNKVSVPGTAASMLHSELGQEEVVKTSGDLQESTTGYSYSVKNRNIKSTKQGSGFGSVGVLAYGSGSRSHADSKLTAQNTSGISITEPGATSPFAGSLQPSSVPKQNNGLILIDPMNDPLDSERIPVGDGLWILVVLSLGYVGWKKRTLFH